MQVAELAGLPASVTKRAKGLLRDIESKKVQASSQLSLLDQVDMEAIVEAPVVVNVDPEYTAKEAALKSLMAEVREYPLMNMSPLEAMNQIAKWKELVSQ